MAGDLGMTPREECSLSCPAVLCCGLVLVLEYRARCPPHTPRALSFLVCAVCGSGAVGSVCQCNSTVRSCYYGGLAALLWERACTSPFSFTPRLVACVQYGTWKGQVAVQIALWGEGI